MNHSPHARPQSQRLAASLPARIWRSTPSIDNDRDVAAAEALIRKRAQQQLKLGSHYTVPGIAASELAATRVGPAQQEDGPVEEELEELHDVLEIEDPAPTAPFQTSPDHPLNGLVDGLDPL
ncbi:hypothetical protein H9P43_002985 [Blastocladiella emersonii ATCC 22665]|nr:hypothetical protein H9P43_002985 [Blastocladiella emersonii ATCC 22665]